MSTSTRIRTEPLSAASPPNGSASDHGTDGHGPDEHSPAGAEIVPSEAARRQQRFADGLRALKVGSGGLKLGERTLMVLGGVLVPLGVIAVLLGWWGASQTPYLFEQVPYVISGGLLGIGLIFLGAFLYFTHWLTELVKEHRVQSAAVVEALQRLQDEVTSLGAGQATTAGTRARHDGEGGDALVATARGTMAHRPGCVVVAGKIDLRSVSAQDGLQLCKLCEAELSTA